MVFPDHTHLLIFTSIPDYLIQMSSHEMCCERAQTCTGDSPLDGM